MKTALIKVRTTVPSPLDGAYIEMKGSLKEKLEKAFTYYNKIIFIGSMGILVRMIQPFIESKVSDPAIIVVDEKLNYCIPVLSAHLGGGIDLCQSLQREFGCTCVLTTSTDINQLTGIDLFAFRNKLVIEDPKAILPLNSKLLNAPPLTVKGFPADFQVPTHYLPSKKQADIGFESGGTVTNLQKQNLVLGVGFHNDMTADALMEAFANLIPKDFQKRILILTSHEKKWHHRVFHEFARKCNIPDTEHFSNSSLSQAIHVLGLEERPVVKKYMGISHVASPSAYLASKKGRELITIKGEKCKFSLYKMNDKHWLSYRYSDEKITEGLI